MNNTIVQINTQEETGSNSALTIAVVASILGVIVIGGVAGYFIYRKYSRLSSPTHIDKVDQSSKNQISVAGSPDGMIDEHFEEQYHPKAELDIFSRKDPFQNKANNADEIDEDEQSEGALWGRQDGATHVIDTEQMHTRIRNSKMQEDVPLGEFST